MRSVVIDNARRSQAVRHGGHLQRAPSEALELVSMQRSDELLALDAALDGGWGAIVSARSGESEDTTIVHLAVAWGAREVLGRSAARRALPILGVAVLVACAALSFVQAGTWQTTERLYRHALAVTSENAKVHYELARYLNRHGRYAEAERHARRATEIGPRYTDAHLNLGAALAGQGRHEEARALAATPSLSWSGWVQWSPARMAWAAIITLLSPEPHTLFTVTAGTVAGTPPWMAACRAGACPTPAVRTFPKTTSCTISGSIPVFRMSSVMVAEPSSGAE